MEGISLIEESDNPLLAGVARVARRIDELEAAAREYYYAVVLISRSCPECGVPFRPSDFEFAINSVQFCCPHCSQSYYGTGQRGHLVPVEFDCAACGRHIHMDDMALLPTEGVINNS